MTSDVPFPPGARVVAYLRDSGGRDQELSVAQQRIQLAQWVEAHGLNLTQIYADEAAPGSSVIGREAFGQLIEHFRSPECRDQGVIIWKFSRFSRDLDDAQYFKADLRRRGYVIYSLHDQIPDTLEGRVIESMIDWMNARFLEDLSTDVKRGLHHNVNQYGALPGTPPRGFKREVIQISSRRDGSAHTVSRWVPDPAWWEKCQAAWRMRANGTPVRQIHTVLHLYTSMESYTWFFKNRIYLGELNYGDITIPNYTEPMITAEIWDAVQKMNRLNSEEHNPMKLTGPQNKNHPRRANSSFLLSGLLYCPRCGALMNGQVVRFKSGNHLDYYSCGNAHRHGDCDAKLIPKIALEEAVIKQLHEYVLDPALIAERDRELAADSAGEVDQLRANQRQARLELAEILRKIDNIAVTIADDPNPPKSLMHLLRELELAADKKSDEIKRLKLAENGRTVTIRTPDQYRELSSDAVAELISGDLPRMKKILTALVARICAERDGDMIRGMITFYNPALNDKNPPNGDGFMPTAVSHQRGSNS